jgi:nitronate monooxygenase
MSTARSNPFALRLPVFAAPMFLISGPQLVLAACKAGIIGAFPTPNARPISELDAGRRPATRRGTRRSAPGAPTW